MSVLGTVPGSSAGAASAFNCEASLQLHLLRLCRHVHNVCAILCNYTQPLESLGSAVYNLSLQ